jgi:mannosyltransferase
MEVARRVFTRNYLFLLAIVIIGLFLRVYGLGAENLWTDEAISVYIAKMSLTQLVQVASAIDLNPPLYAFFLHYWIMLFGDSEFAVRSLSVLFGVLAIPMMFVVGRLLFDEEAGLIGALIFALSLFNVQLSQEARMYSLMVLFALLSMYFFLRFLRKSSRAILAGYVVVTTLLLYTHVFGLFVLLAQNIYLVALLLLSREKTVRLRHWIVLQVIVVGLFALWISVLMSHISAVQRGFWVPPFTVITFMNTFFIYAGEYGTRTTLFTFFFELAVLVFFALPVLSLFRYTKVTGSIDWRAPVKALGNYSRNMHVTNIASVTFLLVWLFTLTVVPFVISRISTPIYLIKYTIAASVALYLLVAGGVRNINWSYVKIAVIAVIVILSAVNMPQYYHQVSNNDTKGQAQEVSNFVIKNAQSEDLVIAFPGWTKFILDYYGRGVNAYVTPFPSADYSSMSWKNENTTENIKELQSDVKGYDRVWIVYWPAYGSAELLIQAKKTLNESFYIQSSQSYKGYELLLFEKRV